MTCPAAPPVRHRPGRRRQRAEQQQLRHGLRRRRRRRDHLRLLVGQPSSLPARLDRPLGGPLLGRRHHAGTGGAAAPTPASRGTVRLTGPGRGAYQTVSAAARRRPHLHLAGHPLPRVPRCDRAASPPPAAGTYTVANVQAGTGADRFAGWALFVAYRDNAQPVRRPARLRRARHGRRNAHRSRRRSRRSTRRPAGPLTTKVGLLTFEGDAGLASETATFNGRR